MLPECIIRWIDGGMTRDRTTELQYIFSFIDESGFDAEIACIQLRSLWTAYCLHHNFDADTGSYDNDLMKLWAHVAVSEGDTAYWSDYDSFGSFMCANLV